MKAREFLAHKVGDAVELRNIIKEPDEPEPGDVRQRGERIRSVVADVELGLEHLARIEAHALADVVHLPVESALFDDAA